MSIKMLLILMLLIQINQLINKIKQHNQTKLRIQQLFQIHKNLENNELINLYIKLRLIIYLRFNKNNYF